MKRIHSVPTPRGAAGAVAAFSPDGRFFAWGLEDGTVHFFDLQTGNIADSLGGHAAGVHANRLLARWRFAESGGDDGLSILWDPVTGQPLARLSGHGSARVLGADFSADGKTLYTASLDGTVFQWDLTGSTVSAGVQNGLSAAAWPGRDRPRRHTTCDFAGRLALCTMRLGVSSVGIYSTTSTQRVATLHASAPVAAVAWSSPGTLAVTGADGLVQLWDVQGAPRLVRRLRRTQVDQRTARDGD